MGPVKKAVIHTRTPDGRAATVTIHAEDTTQDNLNRIIEHIRRIQDGQGPRERSRATPAGVSRPGDVGVPRLDPGRSRKGKS